MQKFNSNFKIFATEATKEKLQNAADHLIGATTTFGEFVGTMDPLSPDDAKKGYEIIELEQFLPITLKSDYKIKVIGTPGHTHDHKSVVLYKNNEVVTAATCVF